MLDNIFLLRAIMEFHVFCSRETVYFSPFHARGPFFLAIFWHEACSEQLPSCPGLYLTIQALNLPKSNLEITQGLKSRAKTIAVAAPGSWIGGNNGGEEECLSRVKACLSEATEA